MNRIHRKVEYALIALKHMRQKPGEELTTVKEICHKYGCSFDTTSRVLQTLVQKGLLKSQQGALGGYSIQKDLNEITLHDLIEILVGPIAVVKCLDTNKGRCNIEANCNVIAPLAHLNQQIIEFYNGINIDEMLNVTANQCVFVETMVADGV